jgi:hypothetical protein
MISPWVGVVGIVVVGAAAMMLRRGGEPRDETVRMPAGDEPDEAPVDLARADEAGEEEEEGAEHLALTSDGHAFAPQGRGVVIAPQRHFRSSRPAGDDGSRMTPAPDESDMQPPLLLSPGDLIAARVVRGSPDLDPWRLETLGRDRDLVVWPFETQDAAEAAHALLDRRGVVKPLVDRDGDAVGITDADFEEAQAELERTLDAFNAPTKDDEIPHPNPVDGRGRER